MKKSHLTLAILTAVLVSACGGSSSNDDATKDHGKPITPSKTTPTTPTKTTPTTPTTNDNSAKKPSTPTTSTTPSDSTPSTPTKTTTPTPTETITPAKTLEQAKADLDKAKQEFQTAVDKANKLDKTAQEKGKEHQAALQALRNLTKDSTATQIAAAKLAETSARLDSANADVNTLKALKEKLSAEKAMAENEVIIAQKDGHDPVKAEKELAQISATLTQFDVFLAESKGEAAAAESDQKKAEVNSLQAQYDAQVEKLANAEDGSNSKTLANKYKDAKQELSSAAVGGDKEQFTTAQKKFNDAKTALEDDDSSLKGIGEKLTEARTKAKEAETKATESQKAAEEAENKLTPEEQAALQEALSPYNGVRFSDSTKDTFGEVRSVSYDKEKGQWSIVFKDKTDTPLTVDVPKDNASKPYGTFTAAKDSNPAQGVKATAYSAYGYVGDKFFSVGELKDLNAYLSKLATAAGGKAASPQTLTYTGTAFVNAIVNKNPQAQVADFEAKATFGDSNTLTGSFSHFQPYDSDVEKFNKLTQKTEAANDLVSFESKIDPKNSSFASAGDADVKVQGFFYQVMNGKDESSAVGGLVDSKKEGHVFKGAFGGEQVTQPTTTQTATTQTATTQTATTQTATTQTAGQ